jgi:hypothetical protein
MILKVHAPDRSRRFAQTKLSDDQIYRAGKPPMKERQSTPTKREAVTNLGLALTAYQQKYDIANGHMAKEIGIKGATLSRIKGGTLPDANGLAKILLWLSEVREFGRR